MYKTSTGIASYGRVANTETNPLKQIVMLYDGAIKFLNLSASDIEAGDFAAKGDHTNRALDIVSYLQSILDLENGGDVAVSLDNLYRSVRILIMRASAVPDAGLMRRAAEILMPMRDAWETNAQTIQTAPTFNMPPAPEHSAFAVVG